MIIMLGIFAGYLIFVLRIYGGGFIREGAV